MNNENFEVKITLLGSPGVGKTCIIKRYTEGEFDENKQSTSGASYSQKTLELGDKKIKIDLWDTAGQEKYRSLGRQFYKDAFIVCLVYDITSLETFTDLQNKWYNDLKAFGEKYKVIAVVGNKSDCFEKEEVKENEARQYAQSIGAIFMLTSAKINSNIDILFNTLIKKYLGPEFKEKVEEIQKERGSVSRVTNASFLKKNKKHKKCC